MPIDVFANFAQTTLAAAVTTTPAAGTSETWAVASTAGFPQIGTGGTQQFRLTVGQPTDPSPEIVVCTAILSAGQITVLRGAEGSTVKTHLVGDPVYQTVTAERLGLFVTSYAPGSSPTTGPPTTGSWVVGQAVVDQNGVAWTCTSSGTPGAWQQAFDSSGAASSAVSAHVAATDPHGDRAYARQDITLTQTVTSSQNVTAPTWATIADVMLIGGGGGGGGGGSANSPTGTSPTSNQAGGGGGAAGQFTHYTVSVTGGTVYPVTVGAGGTGGTGGAAAPSGGNGNAGNGGNAGGNSSGFGLSASGGGPGQPSGANTTTGGKGGIAYMTLNGYGAQAYDLTNTPLPGDGAQYGVTVYQMGPNGLVGGSSAYYQGASSTIGGWGGGAATSPGSLPNLVYDSQPTTANGGPGGTPTVYGCGGGGAGGGAPGGAGGSGGNGAPGVCIITWRAQ